MLMTEVVPTHAGDGTTIRIRIGYNLREYLVQGSYDPSTLDGEQGRKVLRIIKLAGNTPVVAVIGGVEYDVAMATDVAALVSPR